MKRYVVFFFILFQLRVFSQTLPSTVAFTPEEIVNEKVSIVNQNNQIGATTAPDVSIFGNSENSNGLNLSSVSKAQQVSIDLHTESEGLRNSVIDDQTNAGSSNPQGCSDYSVLSAYQKNQCIAADTIQIMGIETLETQNDFRDVADKSYQTMEDVSDLQLNNSNAASFAANSNGVPTSTNMLFPSNTAAISSLNNMFQVLDSKSEYKGLKYNTKADTFYLDGKKYPSSVLNSKDAMIKAGISPALAKFAYAMLSKKAMLAQNKVMSLLKSKNLYDGKKWNIVKKSNQSTVAESADGNSYPGVNDYETHVPQVAPGEAHLSSSLVEEKTLFKDVNGTPLGLSTDDIFKIISRRYRDQDKKGFFHSSPQN